MATVTSVKFLVSGRVQGVYYRASAAAQAESLGLSGWARNLSDGRVEVVVRGAQEQVARLAAWLWQGPPQARVSSVVLEEWAGDVGPRFRIER
jgi:acylphosphatase